MGTESLDYTAILNDLEAKKKAIEAAIASLRSALSVGALGLTLADASVGMQDAVGFSFSTGEVPDGAFLGKSIPEAVKLYLEIVKKKQTTRQIADALRKGGIESISSRFPTIIHATLNRVRKSPNSPIVKVGTLWGLSGWYPKGITSGPTEKRSKKSKHKTKAAKKVGLAATNEIKTALQSVPIADKKKGGAVERISQILQSKPSGEFTAQQIAEQTSLNVQVAHMMLARLAKQGKAHKTPSGAYRTIGSSTMHAVM